LILKRKEKFEEVLSWFRTHVPVAETELKFGNAYELLVAVVLSAQCTDKRVNQVTPDFFLQFPDADSLAKASPEEVFPLIKSISYPNNKAKHLSGLGKMLVEKFDGEVPNTVEELMLLPGVGRKTANVLVSVVYEKPAMAVDTHVFRVSRRLGLSKGNTPLKVEQDLIRHIPVNEVHKAHHWFILHGRYLCTARKPQCSNCSFSHFCDFVKK
jgi:endonuclease-3